ncbi:MAG: DNA double-strand break repair protein Mre11, partial [Cyanobacteria bacterium J06639_14]
GLEDQIARYKGALRYDELLPLRKAGVDYLALGHIHKNYSVEDWIFNPGSLEANNIEEGKYDRGAYLVELTPSGIQASLQQDYQQRSIVRLQVRTRGEESETELTELAVSAVETAIAQGRLVPNDQPIVELRIEGTVGFERLSLDTRHLQQTLQAMSQALIFLLKYDVEEISFQSPTADEASREQIEENAFLDLLAGHRDYKKRAPELANALVDLKNRCLVGQDDAALYQYVEDILTASSDRQNSSS